MNFYSHFAYFRICSVFSSFVCFFEKNVVFEVDFVSFFVWEVLGFFVVCMGNTLRLFYRSALLLKCKHTPGYMPTLGSKSNSVIRQKADL